MFLTFFLLCFIITLQYDHLYIIQDCNFDFNFKEFPTLKFSNKHDRNAV